MNLLHVLLLAVIQGAAELLPVSSSAHVILAERLLGLDPAAPEMTFLLVMLHTGTMVAVLVHFWPRWRALLRGESLAPAAAAAAPTGTAPGAPTAASHAGPPNAAALAGRAFLTHVLIATIVTGVVGLGLKTLIEKVVLRANPDAEIEQLFRNLPLMAASLAVVGLLIVAAGARDRAGNAAPLSGARAAAIGLVQGLCLPFRGFSRSGATISTGLFQGLSRGLAEDFSFALAVVLTPPVIARELHRLMKHSAATAGDAAPHGLARLVPHEALVPSLVGLAASFCAGLVALKVLSSALEHGRWRLFGYYCLVFAGVVLGAHFYLTR